MNKQGLTRTEILYLMAIRRAPVIKLPKIQTGSLSPATFREVAREEYEPSQDREGDEGYEIEPED